MQNSLKYGTDLSTADQVSCFNDGIAEAPGYAFKTTSKLKETLDYNKDMGPTTFYDSINGQPLFKAPVGRSLQEFTRESEDLGFLSFRDKEVNWEKVRILENGYLASTDGVFLGINAPDNQGNRYAVNLSAISGQDATQSVDEGALFR